MAVAAPISALVMRDIIDSIGSDETFFLTEGSDYMLPGPRTLDTIELEKSIQRLIARFRNLDLKNAALTSIENGAISKHVNNVKHRSHNCLSCGQVLETPLTPDGTPIEYNHSPSRKH